VLGLLEGGGIPCTLSDRLVRGLDYYTRTVFEIQHGGLGAQNAVGGGGRYDRLVEEVGGPDTPGVGFSTGIERILLALEADGAGIPGVRTPQIALAVAGDEAERAAAAVLARRLRKRFRVDLDLLGRGLGAQMKAAHRLGARVVVVVGPEEIANAAWTVKDMASGEQETVSDSDLEARLESLLEPQEGEA
jgi:histidyl-tRNA synthetase